jgi:hypothetical protein
MMVCVTRERCRWRTDLVGVVVQRRERVGGRIAVAEVIAPARLAAVGVGRGAAKNLEVLGVTRPPEGPVMCALRYMVEKAAIAGADGPSRSLAPGRSLPAP